MAGATDQSSTRALYDAMIAEDDPIKRRALTREYVDAVRAENEAALRRSGGFGLAYRLRHDRLSDLRRSVNWLWFIVGLNTAAILIHELSQ